ncbi:hypothetical protein [Cellulosimicrobium cellulans]|uniref:hypothetical protein n=1 Tax=Cellulosimicrobium cellulans TaxID=1710 RepID=UPI000848D057|nr:hypothetical protein [Cellulosimicrobium cellulans]
MGDGERDANRRAVRAARVGLVAVLGYALVGALQTLVWNPLAAVPGATLGEIHAELAQADESLSAPLVLGWALVGTLLAAAVLRAAWQGSVVRVLEVVVLDLLILVAAVPSHWFASFPAGMGIADAFGTTGAQHAPWGMVLYAVSAVALLVLVAGLLVRGRAVPVPPT